MANTAQCRDSLKIFMLYRIIHLDDDEALIRKENYTWGYFQRYDVAPIRIIAYNNNYHDSFLPSSTYKSGTYVLPNYVSKPVKSAKYIIHSRALSLAISCVCITHIHEGVISAPFIGVLQNIH